MKLRNWFILPLLVSATSTGCFADVDPNAQASQGSASSTGGHVAKGGASNKGGASAQGGADTAGGDDAGGETGGTPNHTTGGTSSTGGKPPKASGGATGGKPEVTTGGTGPIEEPKGACLPPRSSELLSARSSVMSGAPRVDTKPYTLVSVLKEKLRSQCAHCHEDRMENFLTQVTQEDLDRILSTDPKLVMPKYGPTADKRSPDDPVGDLAKLLKLWLDQKRPKDLIELPATASQSESRYLMPIGVGDQLTNLGSCVPENDFPFAWGHIAEEKMDAMDQFFAQLQRDPNGSTGAQQLGLPPLLSQTDLVTFDSEELARNGIIEFVPAYPLWSDGSGKLRHVRVPRGQSIPFNKAKQTFEIPPNTRFYKTFLKKVTDDQGQVRFRKIETRIIVSRPESPAQAGALVGQVGALFGSYKWNAAETEAELVVERRHDLTVSGDLLFTYPLDEIKHNELINKVPRPSQLEQRLIYTGADRHYAIPGSDRCVQCHQGTESFVLGFTPLQIWRRPVGFGGVIEPTAPDELNQLDRLIALGVITGIRDSGDILPLEESQGTRKPRNNHELIAQGYMLGNCAHCHTPRGYATTSTDGILADLRFMPSADGGGIFQFPLEFYSPRVFRGVTARDIPYITPSLRDLVPYDLNADIVSTYGIYANKWEGDQIPRFWDAPWRSLIYRNTQTPFTYSDDYAIFPHMPLNTAGHDCRASKIFGAWMVSIPARRKNPNHRESNAWDNHVSFDAAGFSNPSSPSATDPKIDNESQPYLEVLPGETKYPGALLEAEERLGLFWSGIRYQTCPDSSDILDPVADNKAGSVPIPLDKLPPLDRSPDHPHWVSVDFTEFPGPYQPRRSEFAAVLGPWPAASEGVSIEGYPWPHGKALPNGDNPPYQKWRREAKVLDLLRDVRAGEPRPPAEDISGKYFVGADQDRPGVTRDAKLLSFIQKPFPLAVWKDWQQKGETKCDFSKGGIKSAGSYTTDRPRWMDVAKVPDAAPIFEKLPGGIIYDSICINCHGPKLDSQGRQADTVQQLTGGVARVANFLQGLYGPESAPGSNRIDNFSQLSSPAAAPADQSATDVWASRYLTWMALGGTKVNIPRAVLDLVALTNVAGERRGEPLTQPGTASANMLEAAEVACGNLIDIPKLNALRAMNLAQWGTLFPRALDIGKDGKVKNGELIYLNGDAEMWRKICTINNPPPIFGIHFFNGAPQINAITELYQPGQYPAAPIGNHLGKVDADGLHVDDNLFPWCVSNLPCPPDVAECPVCPPGLEVWEGVLGEREEDWARRGAINAGFAVYEYIKQVSEHRVKPVRYDECELVVPKEGGSSP